ncbi:MAG: sodium:calcium antiporter [Thermoplasmataceae archaeon]
MLSVIGLSNGGEGIFHETMAFARKLRMGTRFTGTVILSIVGMVDELAVVTVATIQGNSSLSFGTVIGSNILVLFLFLLLFPLSAGKFMIKDFRLDSIIILAVGTITLIAYFTIGVINWEVSVILLGVMLVYILLSSGEKTEQPSAEGERYSIVIALSALISLTLASINLVHEADYVASYLRISSFYSGILVTGGAGSLPELYLLYFSIRTGREELGTGIVIGSTVFKSTLAVAIAIIAEPVQLSGDLWPICIFIILSVILFIVSITGPRKHYAVLTFVAVAAGTLLFLQ